MNQIILISQDPELRKSLDEECLSLRECLFTSYEALDEFLPLIDIFTGFELIIIDGNSISDVGPIFHALKKRKEKFARYIFYSNRHEKAESEYIVVPNRLELTFHLKQVEFLHLNSDRFMGIPLESLSHFDSLPFPLYISLSSEKFVKRIPAFETFDYRVLLGYKARGVNEFYFERVYARDFTTLLMNNMMGRIERQYEDKMERELATAEIYGAVREIISIIGLKPKVIELCQKLIDQITASICEVKDYDLSDYLRRLRTRPELDFNYRLTELTSFLSGEILGGAQEPLRDLIFAAFFCDMSLKFPNHVHLRKEADLQELSEEDTDAVAGHAAASAEMVAFKNICSNEAFKVILQHHGSQDGVGFPLNPEEGIEDLSKSFIIAHELAYALLTRPEAGVWTVCQELIDRYKGTTLEPIVLKFELNLLKDKRWGL